MKIFSIQYAGDKEAILAVSLINRPLISLLLISLQFDIFTLYGCIELKVMTQEISTQSTDRWDLLLYDISTGLDWGYHYFVALKNPFQLQVWSMMVLLIYFFKSI